MSFPRYPAYKESGVEWMPRVPTHWTVERLRFVSSINPSRSEIAHLGRDTFVSFLPMEAIGDDGRMNPEQLRPLGEVETGYSYFREGDVTIAKITPCFENGKGAVMRGLRDGIGFGTTELIVVRPSRRMDGCFLDYLFRSSAFRHLGEAQMYGAGGQKRVPDSFVRNFAAPIPPHAEQLAIAAFLDRETAKIDALVAEQERLIELLKEKRQAVISHAVTKGLNPDAPMKDSGIEWLGRVPAHWEVKRGRFLYDKVELPPTPKDGVVTAFRDGQVTLRENRRTDGFTLAVLEVGYQHVREGDLVVHGMDAFAGAIGVSESTGKCTPEYSVLSPTSPAIDNHYFAMVLRLMALRNYILVICPSVRERAPRFRYEAFKDVLLPVPPFAEQRHIIAHVRAHDAGSAALAAEAERAIALLQERRTALISAAITGQIDVRSAAAGTASTHAA